MSLETEPQLPAADTTTEPAGADTSAGGATTSMEDTIRSAYRAQSLKATQTEIGDAVNGQGKEKEAAAAEPRTNSAGRLIDEQGRFLKADGTIVATEAEADLAVPEKAVEAPAAASKPHDTAPNTWKKDVAAKFGELPENIRQEIHRREQDFFKGIGQYKEAATFASQIAKELLPHEPVLRQLQLQPAEFVKQASAILNTLATGTADQKASVWLQIAKDYGIDPSSLGSAPPQDAAQAIQVDPAVAALKRELSEIKTHLTSQERQRAEAEFSQHTESVTAFGSDPKHEHFDSVREDMAALIETGRAKDLQDAYDKAIWAHPEVRTKLLAKQEQERTRKLADEAAAARKAAGANVTRRGTPPVPNKPGTMEDTIRSEFRRLNGGG
jgi:hypothetical protein